MCSQKWNCATSFPISTFMCLWAIYIFPVSVCPFGCSKIGRLILGIYKLLTDTWMWKLGTEHYNSVLEIKRPRSFISWNTYIGTRHVYWILTGSSFAMYPKLQFTYLNKERSNSKYTKRKPYLCSILSFHLGWFIQDNKLLCNDGIGDLVGITQRLDHLVDLGDQKTKIIYTK